MRWSAGWTRLRLAGLIFVLPGAASLIALVTPLRDWILRNNLADLTALVDRRASNNPGGGVDTPETVVIGGIIAIVVGLWVGWGVPNVIDRSTRARPDGTTNTTGTKLGWIFVGLWIVLWLAMLGGLALWAPWW